jgi:hypothetical protein
MRPATCGACGNDTPSLSACPCGLGAECRIAFGVCAPCWRIIQRNHMLRRLERLARTLAA